MKNGLRNNLGDEGTRGEAMDIMKLGLRTPAMGRMASVAVVILVALCMGASLQAAPGSVGFLAISDIKDLHLRGNYAYAMQIDNLVTISIGDPTNPAVEGSVGLRGFFVSSDLAYPYLYVAESQSCAPLGGACQGWNGIEVIDVSNATAPVVVADLAMAGIRQIAFHGANLHVLQDRTFVVVNIGHPAAPFVAGSASLRGRFLNVAFEGSYACVLEAAYRSGFLSPLEGINGLEVIKLFGPRVPEVVSYLELAALDQNFNINDFLVSDSYGYVGHTAGTLEVLDLRNPLAPLSTSTLALKGAFPRLTYSPGLLFIREKESCTGLGNNRICAGLNGLEVASVTDPVHPFSLGSVEIPKIGALMVEGSSAYAAGDQTLQLLDTRNPAHPVPTASVPLRGFFFDQNEMGRADFHLYIEVSRSCSNIFDPTSCSGETGIEVIDISPSNCATLDVLNGVLHIPCLQMEQASYWVDLFFASMSPLQMGLSDLGPVETRDAQSATFDFFTLTLHVPCFALQGISYWLDLGLISTDPIRFTLTGWGENGL
jgi:hypothetical protein